LELHQLRSGIIDLGAFRTHAVWASAEVLRTLGPEWQGCGVHTRLFVLLKGIGGPEDTVHIYDTWVHGHRNYHELPRLQLGTYDEGLQLSRHIRQKKIIRSSFETDKYRGEDRCASAIRFRCVVPKSQPNEIQVIISVAGLGLMAKEAVALLIAQNMPWQVQRLDLAAAMVASDNAQARHLLFN
jgi:hypothetical protein